MSPGNFVAIMLVTGEIRRVAMSEVEYAGPAANAPGLEPGAPDDGKVKVKLTALQKDLTYYIPYGKSVATSVGASVGGGGGFGVGVGVGASGGSQTNFARICIAPCVVSLPRGNHRLAVGSGDDPPVVFDDPIAIDHALTVEGNYRSYSGVRFAGRMVSLAALAVGVAVIVEFFA